MEKNTSSKPELFHCPTCGASLPVPEAASVRCEYCGSNILVPAEFRAQKPSGPSGFGQPVIIQVPGQAIIDGPASSRRPRTGILTIILVLVGICVIGGIALSAAGVFTTTALVNNSIEVVSTQVSQSQLTVIPTATQPDDTPTPTSVPPLSVEVTFGGEGSGPGQFDDPRYVAVDPDFNILVADYMDGRIQKFDPTGKFLQLIQVEPDTNENTIVLDIAADYSGNLYIIRGGDILVYAISDGKLEREIPGRFPDLSYNKLAVDAANSLYAINGASPFKDLIKLDADGNVVWEKANFLEPIINKNKPFNVADIVVDGLGNIFILNSSGYEIYRFDPQGNFVDRFGSQGEEQQQFSNPSSLAIDGKGRLFVFDSGDGYWLKTVDPGGTYLESLAWPDELTYPRMILFDAQGKLYIVTNTNQVGRMKLNE